MVERIDLQHPAGDGGRELGDEEHPPEILAAVNAEREGRVTGGAQCGDTRIGVGVGALGVAQVDEDAV